MTATQDPGARPPTLRVPPARRLVTIVLLVATCALVLNVLVGARGLPAVLQARRDHQGVTSELQRIRDENAALRREIQRLRTDPDAIEELARGELGYIAPGEKLFIIREAQPAEPK